MAGDLVIQGRTDVVTVADLAERCNARVLRPLLAAGISAEGDTEVPGDPASLRAGSEVGDRAK